MAARPVRKKSFFKQMQDIHLGYLLLLLIVILSAIAISKLAKQLIDIRQSAQEALKQPLLPHTLAHFQREQYYQVVATAQPKFVILPGNQGQKIHKLTIKNRFLEHLILVSGTLFHRH